MIFTPSAEYNKFKADLGHGGRLDIQRDASKCKLYHPLVKGSNYLVGVYTAAAGLDEVQTEIIGFSYALHNDKYPVATFERDIGDWIRGAEDYYSGKVK